MKSKKVTIYDIAKKTGLSVATVSRVLNKNESVKEETRELVNNVIRELNYVPNVFARSLKNKPSYSIGVIVHDIRSPFFSELIASIEDYFTNKDYHILLAAVSGSLKNELELLHFFVHKKIDGIMLLGSKNDKRIYKELETLSLKIPVVLVGDFIDLNTIYSVNCDNKMGAYKAVKYMIDLGHRNIGFVTGYKNQYDSEERFKGYREALSDAGIEFNSSYIFQGDFSASKCQNGISQFITRSPEITALFCCSDMMAVGSLSSLLQAGIKVPDDVSIVGFDNIQMSAYVYPSITTVDQGVERLGKLASSLLNDAINSSEMVPQRVINKTNLIIRDSTASVKSQ